jgi:hypothetical protein
MIHRESFLLGKWDSWPVGCSSTWRALLLVVLILGLVRGWSAESPQDSRQRPIAVNNRQR